MSGFTGRRRYSRTCRAGPLSSCWSATRKQAISATRPLSRSSLTAMRKTTQSIAANALQNANILSKNYNSFEDLFNDVNRIVGNINGVGQLTVYDISIRLGHLFSPRLRPTLVYLNRAPYKSAKKLLGRTPKRIESPSVFSNFFGNLEPIYIEDILCICKCVFAKLPFTNCPSNQIPPYCLKKNVICMYIQKSNQSTKNKIQP